MSNEHRPCLLVFEQEDTLFKTVAEIVKKFRKNQNRELPAIRMSDLRDDVLSLSGSIAAIELAKKSPIPKPPRAHRKLNMDQPTAATYFPEKKTIENLSSTSPPGEASIIPTHADTATIDDIKFDHNHMSVICEKTKSLDNSPHGTITQPTEVSEKLCQNRPFKEIISAKTPKQRIPVERADNDIREIDPKVAKVVHELVLEKYGNVLKNFKHRSLSRQRRSSTSNSIDCDQEPNRNKKYERRESTDSGLSSAEEDFSTKNTPQKESDAFTSEHNRDNYIIDISQMNISDTNVEQVEEFDGDAFLAAALGDEFMDISDDSKVIQASCSYDNESVSSRPRSTVYDSIGESRISALISSPESPQTIDSLYSSVNKKMKTKNKTADSCRAAKPLFSVSKERSYCDYDSIIAFRSNSIEEELIIQNSLQREIIHQISKALEVCRSDPECYGEDVLLEAEKILLVATYRKDVLAREITKTEYEEVGSEHVTISVNVKNIKFRLDYEAYSQTSRRDRWYFMCILDSGKTVLTSNIVRHNDNGTIIFPGDFKFEKLSSDIEINISMYAISLTRQNMNSKLCKTFGRRRNRPNEMNNTQSAFTLLGRATIKNHSLMSKTFKLSQMPANGILSNTVALETDLFLKLNFSKCGFLTIGMASKGVPIRYHRRWCVLEGSKLKYWNDPIETERAPIGNLDMLNCLSQVVLRADRNVCNLPRTIYLEIMDSKGVAKEIFLSADSQADLESWQDNLNLVIRTLARWNSVSCFLLN